MAVDRAEWCRLPPLSRLVLGTRKAVGIRLRDLAEEVAPGQAGVADEILAFERGLPIRRELFARVAERIGLDRDLARGMIRTQRAIEEQGHREWAVRVERTMSLRFGPSPLSGVNRRVPREASREEAIELAKVFAKTHGPTASLHFEGELIRVTREGEVMEEGVCVAWSEYPFGVKLSLVPVKDGWG